MRHLRSEPSLLAAVALAITLAGAQAAAAQTVESQTAEYREALTRCVEAGDMICALEVLLDYGTRQKYEPVAVSVQGGPTVFGTQLFAVLNRAGREVAPDTYKAMTEAAVNYVLDAQPDAAYAAAPFILLNGEACDAVGDKRCAVNAASAVQLMLSSGNWYFPGIGDMRGENNVRHRAQAFVDKILGGTQ